MPYFNKKLVLILSINKGGAHFRIKGIFYGRKEEATEKSLCSIVLV